MSLAEHPGRHDFGERRRSKRSGRERGCWLYIPAEALEASRWPLDAAPPFYRTWATPKGKILVQFYKTK